MAATMKTMTVQRGTQILSNSTVEGPLSSSVSVVSPVVMLGVVSVGRDWTGVGKTRYTARVKDALDDLLFFETSVA